VTSRVSIYNKLLHLSSSALGSASFLSLQQSIKLSKKFFFVFLPFSLLCIIALSSNKNPFKEKWSINHARQKNVMKMWYRERGKESSFSWIKIECACELRVLKRGASTGCLSIVWICGRGKVLEIRDFLERKGLQ
jgi:hypothetical protein